MKSIIIVIDYFGKWPPWFPIFLESCKANATINWLFHTDCCVDEFNIPNIKFKYISLRDYVRQVSERLNIKFAPGGLYKLADLRPATGYLYEEEIKGYDFFGYGDIDLIYGDIRKFYTDEVLENNVISNHEWCISGHLALIKNKRWLRKAFMRVKNWKAYLEAPTNQRFDEDVFTQVFKRTNPSIATRRFFNKKYRKNLYLVEQYTTPLTPIRWRNGIYPHPQTWYWKDGRITSDHDRTSEYIYLHFMNYKEARYMDPVYGTKAFWDGLPSIMHINSKQILAGVKIDRFGFHSVETG